MADRITCKEDAHESRLNCLIGADRDTADRLIVEKQSRPRSFFHYDKSQAHCFSSSNWFVLTKLWVRQLAVRFVLWLYPTPFHFQPV